MSKTYSIVDTETGQLISVSTEPPGIKTPGRVLTHLAFMRRMTDTELATIYAAAEQNQMIAIWLDKFRLADEINLYDPEIVGGIRQLEAAGILAPGRADEVLA